MANSAAALKAYFSTPEKPVSTKEMMEFWQSLTDEDKEFYRNAELS